MVGGQAIDLEAVGRSHGADALDRDGLKDMHAEDRRAHPRRGDGRRPHGRCGTAPRRGPSIATRPGSVWRSRFVDDVLDVEGKGQDLGKTAARTRPPASPPTPRLFGLDASKRLAQEAADAAVAALAGVQMDRSRLAEIAQWVVSRTS